MAASTAAGPGDVAGQVVVAGQARAAVVEGHRDVVAGVGVGLALDERDDVAAVLERQDVGALRERSEPGRPAIPPSPPR